MSVYTPCNYFRGGWDQSYPKAFCIRFFIINPLGNLFFKCCCLHNYIDTNWLYIKSLIIYLYVSNNMDFRCLQIKYYIEYLHDVKLFDEL